QVQRQQGATLDYLRELIWDNSSNQGMKQDRFFAWADTKLIEQVDAAARAGQFAPQPGSLLFHPGASRKWKQMMQPSEANLQLTFHEEQAKTIGGVSCIVVEPDFDYYKDASAHSILEVIA